ncbi:TRAP transporter small permease [Pannonibacter carbonis]|uniref:TRAP transporter small permease n=1 Tax=Pannonibacter carbonis TaxID=2067569 RepID=UPI000D100995|nr:TRAP transporter small permease [Pannonibacter carbonis]
MHALKTRVDHALGVFIAAVFAVLVTCVVWQVFSRYVLNAPSTVTDELARFLFMWVGLIGAAYTLGQRKHLAIDLLMQMAGPSNGRWLALLATVIVGAFAAVVMVYGGYNLVQKTLASGQLSPALRLPMGYVYGAIPFAGIMMVLYCLEFAAGVISGRIQPIESDAEVPANGPQT